MLIGTPTYQCPFILCTYLGMGALRAAESVNTEHAAEPKRAERALFTYHRQRREVAYSRVRPRPGGVGNMPGECSWTGEARWPDICLRSGTESE
jgi:hypothetical protein